MNDGRIEEAALEEANRALRKERPSADVPPLNVEIRRDHSACEAWLIALNVGAAGLLLALLLLDFLL
jgi:hypothetical protein